MGDAIFLLRRSRHFLALIFRMTENFTVDATKNAVDAPALHDRYKQVIVVKGAHRGCSICFKKVFFLQSKMYIQSYIYFFECSLWIAVDPVTFANCHLSNIVLTVYFYGRGRPFQVKFGKSNTILQEI